MNRSRLVARLATLVSLVPAVGSCGPDAPTTPPTPSAAVVQATPGVQANAGGVMIAAPASARLHPGDKIQLTATVVLPNGKDKDKFPIKWSTSSAAVATVDEKTGEVTAVAPGAVTITAKAGPRAGQLALTVMVPVARVTISPNPVTMDWNTQDTAKVVLTVAAFDASSAPISDLADRSIVWKSNDTTTATVAATDQPGQGRVTGVLMGKTTISVTVDGVQGTAQVTVAPEFGYLNNGELPTLAVGDSFAATMYFVTANNERVPIDETMPGPKSWVSLNPAVATVTQAGVIHAVAVGTSTIQGTYRGFTASANLTVSSASSVPNAPIGLDIGFDKVALFTYQISVGWSSNGGNEDEFQVERAVGGTTNFVRIATVEGGAGGGRIWDPDYTTENTLYTYRVRACNAAGCSAYSSPISMPGPLREPTDLIAAGYGSGGIRLTWQDNTTREDGYVVKVGVVGAGGSVTFVADYSAPPNATEYIFSGVPVAPPTTIIFAVVACANVAGYGNSCSAGAISQQFTF